MHFLSVMCSSRNLVPFSSSNLEIRHEICQTLPWLVHSSCIALVSSYILVTENG